MATSFPTSLDALTNPTSANTLASPDHAGQHTDANDAIEAIEAQIGTTASPVLARLASPTFTGTPTLPTGTIATTQTAGNSTTAVATTAFVTTADNLKANLASPTFTGTPTLPTGTIATTQSAGNNTTAVATTAFVTTADDLKQNLPVGVAWTPTLASGTWTLITWTGRYVQANKLVKFWILGTATGACVLGTGFSIPVLNFPVAPQNAYAGGGHGTIISDVSAAVDYTGVTAVGSGSSIRPMAQGTAGTYATTAQLATAVPMTWASGDYIFIHGTYEAA